MVGARCSFFLMVLWVGNLHADWLAFRGSQSNGVAESSAPTICDDANIAWSVDVPGRSVSSPIVVSGEVVLTASSGMERERLHVLGIDAATGKTRWHRQFWATGRTMSHPTSANAAPTPVSDGEHIVASFSSNDVVCLNLDGELQWFRGLGTDFPQAVNDIGMASSPALVDGVVICQVENQGDSFVTGMDVVDGTTLWRIDRPRSANWTSPVRLPADEDLVLLKSSEGVSAHHPRTGETVWHVAGEVGGIPTMAVSKTKILVPGSTFLLLDRNDDRVQVSLQSKTIRPDPSPIVTDERFYMINSVGVLSANRMTDGETIWKVRVAGKKYWASPVLAGQFIYTINQEGSLDIVDANSGKKVDSYQFDDEVMGTPAISDGALFVRGVSRLWKVATP